MARKNPQLIVREYVDSEIDLTELDLSLYDWLEARGARDLSENGYDVDVRPRTDLGWHGDAEPIPLETLELLLAEMRAAKATHVEIMQHGDHNGYHAYGVRIRMGTREEAEEFRERARTAARARAAKNVAELEKQLAEQRKLAKG